ncbi:MAG: type II secretion system minor pseudopilin GspH [Hahellaceae bacterium]|nr:type II secretion system minor pseudopilin GspH [Hahellaceae bacterium]MCP5170406.1 type II secretion system minor pseudopilin GspH [Hahellaceae bacterium]
MTTPEKYFSIRKSLDPRSTGFTLIEILIVLVILSLVTGIAVFYVGGSNVDREMENEARRLHGLFRLAADEAVISNQEIGFYFDEEGYEFLSYDEKEQQWLAMQSDTLRARRFPSWLSSEFQGEANTVSQLAINDEKEQHTPLLVFLSSGETTPFKIQMAMSGDSANGFEIFTNGLDPITIQRIGAVSE